MPRIYLCFVWHMHQPCYKDLVSGEYRLPWTRLHGLKDYYGMVKVLGEFPQLRQTFNLVPSLLMQIEEYATGKAEEPFLRCALKPAEDLTEAEIGLILHYFFQANPIHLIGRYPRFAELHDAWKAADRNVRRASRVFNAQALRDLQVLSQLAWFEEEFLAHDPEVRELVAKGKNYSLDDQALMGRKQIEILQRVIPVYREFAQSGQIEVSATPFYHPILPLLCDSNIAHEANPHVPLPSRFRFPQDARLHLERSIEYVNSKIGVMPTGLWPSEGSVSDEALTIAADVGYRWAATDNGVLAKTLGRAADPSTTYRHYRWRREGRELSMIFRDHYLSDLVGFVYSRMDAATAARDFLERIQANCQPLLAQGRDALVPIVLDGENAWEHYYLNGRPFLRELYRRIAESDRMQAVTVSEGLSLVEGEAFDHVAPGSWIGANFDVWIGFDEDNRAWEHLLQARETFERVPPASIAPEEYALAQEELMIAEGSDWCWWYGPHHHSDNRVEFDQLFRDHLANMYRALRLTPPDGLSRPILRTQAQTLHQRPLAPIHAKIDGEVTSYFEWLGAGIYRVDGRGGAMHGQRFIVKELQYGMGNGHLCLRVDFLESELASLPGMEVRITVNGVPIRIRLDDPVEVMEGAEAAKIAFRRILECSIPISDYRALVEVSVWQNGLPLDALPPDGPLEVSVSEPEEWTG